MFLDIDHFKAINDTLGRGAGDLAPKEFGARLRHQVPSTDIVARLAGDEFVALAEAIATRANGASVEAPVDGFIVFPNPNASVGTEWFHFGHT